MDLRCSIFTIERLQRSRRKGNEEVVKRGTGRERKERDRKMIRKIVDQVYAIQYSISVIDFTGMSLRHIGPIHVNTRSQCYTQPCGSLSDHYNQSIDQSIRIMFNV